MKEKKQPVKKIRSGRISVTLWKRQITAKTGATVELQRACVQHSSKDRDTGAWTNQQIWLNVDELRDVANALEQLNEETEEKVEVEVVDDAEPTQGEKSPCFSPHGSVRAHRIIEYIKTNSLDAGLDVYDLQELTVDQVLAEYGIHAKLTSWEKPLILDDLRRLVEQREFAEASYCAKCYSYPLLA